MPPGPRGACPSATTNARNLHDPNEKLARQLGAGGQILVVRLVAQGIQLIELKMANLQVAEAVGLHVFGVGSGAGEPGRRVVSE